MGRYHYEFTLVFDIDIKHFAVTSKDRTGLFMGKPEFLISEYTGKEILNWCNSGVNPKVEDNTLHPLSISTPKLSHNDLVTRIQESNTIAELLALYKMHPEYQQILKPHYEARKSLLINLSNPQNFSNNGKH